MSAIKTSAFLYFISKDSAVPPTGDARTAAILITLTFIGLCLTLYGINDHVFGYSKYWEAPKTNRFFITVYAIASLILIIALIYQFIIL